MSQKRNSVQLSATAIARLQKLVDSGEYCSIDDAANHILMTALGSTTCVTTDSGLKNISTHQYSPVLTKNEPEPIPNEVSTGNAKANPSSKPPPFAGL